MASAVPPTLRSSGVEWWDDGAECLHRKSVSVVAHSQQEALQSCCNCAVTQALCCHCLAIPALIVCVRELCIWVCDTLCLEIWPGPRAFQACVEFYQICSLASGIPVEILPGIHKMELLPGDWYLSSHSRSLRCPECPEQAFVFWCWFPVGMPAPPLWGEPHSHMGLLFSGSIIPSRSIDL